MSNAELHKGALLKHGEYRIERTLGQGGFGITYEAEQVSLGRKVAIKEFYMKDYCYRNEATRLVSTASSVSREMVDSFRRKFVKEARMLAEFKHRSIVRVLDVFEENDTAYYVMEYLEGGSLQSMVRRKGRLEEEEAVRYIGEICDALNYIHSRHTLHLDVKPGNIMLDSEGRAVLIDFGISKRIDSDGNLTTTTPLCLSKGFAPFEQIAQEPGSSYTASTDIYSLGATLYCLLTGKTPYDASTLIDGLPTSELKSAGVSVRTIKAISAAMQFRREKRPQSASEFKKLLCCTTSGNGFPKWLLGVLAGLAAIVAIALFAGRCGSESVSFATGINNGHEYVDLGLSVKWATRNVGASSPEGYGSSFAWGETSPKSDYSWTTLKYRTEGDSYDNVKFSKYVASSQYGPVDNKTVLDLSDDAARANWGGSWRMPTIDEFQELIDKCTWTWTKVNGKKGYKVVSKSNGNSIFLPAAGYRDDSSLIGAGGGFYWSGSLYESDSYYARELYFHSGRHETDYYYRYQGYSVRPVFR